MYESASVLVGSCGPLGLITNISMRKHASRGRDNLLMFSSYNVFTILAWGVSMLAHAHLGLTRMAFVLQLCGLFTNQSMKTDQIELLANDKRIDVTINEHKGHCGAKHPIVIDTI